MQVENGYFKIIKKLRKCIDSFTDKIYTKTNPALCNIDSNIQIGVKGQIWYYKVLEKF